MSFNDPFLFYIAVFTYSLVGVLLGRYEKPSIFSGLKPGSFWDIASTTALAITLGTVAFKVLAIAVGVLFAILGWIVQFFSHSQPQLAFL